MKIIVTGSVNVGKSSVIERLAETRPDVLVVPEAARQYLTAHPDEARQPWTYETQHAISKAALENMRNAVPLPGQHVLYDRSPFDAAAFYGRRAFDSHLADIIGSSATVEVRAARVILFSIHGMPETHDELWRNGLRERAAIEEALETVYKRRGVNLEVVTGNWDDRLNHMQQLLGPPQIAVGPNSMTA